MTTLEALRIAIAELRILRRQASSLPTADQAARDEQAARTSKLDQAVDRIMRLRDALTEND